MSPLVIVLIIFGVLAVLGVGAILALVVLVGAAASADPTPVATPALTAPAATGPFPLEDDTANGATGNAGLTPPGTPTTTAATPAAPAATGGTKFICSASGSVRVCGFSNVCNFQSVFGTGISTNRDAAALQAKNACQGMAIAKGGSTVCAVSCQQR